MCIPFILGILIQQEVEGIAALVIGLVLTVILSIFPILCKNIHRKQQVRTGLLVALMFTMGTFLRSSVEPSQTEIQRLSTSKGLVSASVRNVTRTDYGHKAYLSINAPSTFHRNIRAIAYVQDSSVSLLPGDTLIFHGGLQIISSPGNPYAFDAAKYYVRQGIHLKTYLDSARIISHLRYHGGFHLVRKSAEIRAAIQKIYQTYVMNEQSCAVLLAMTIGIVDGLDDNIYDAYAKTGTIHVLSISGLHVGIVSVLLFLIVGRVRPSDKIPIKIFRIAMLLSGIWTFAFIAGLAPSITRASLMTSIFLTGIILRRPSKGLNVMAFTAFACLSLDPLQINSLSFQFSYLALGGILIFFKPLYRLVAVRSHITKFIWGTIVMSIAAQLLLLPLLIHYFQQISTISILSSLIAIPASYVILIGGVLILLLHHLIPAGAELAGQGMNFSISVVNDAIIGMSNLPLSHFSNIFLSPLEVAILSGGVVLFALRILTQRRQWTFATASAIALFGVFHAYSEHTARNNEMLAIYPNGDHVAIDFVAGNRCYTTFEAHTMSKYHAKEIAAFRNTFRVSRSQVLVPSPFDTSDHVHVLDLAPKKSFINDSMRFRIAVITDPEFDLEKSDILDLHADWIILSAGLSYTMRQTAEDFFTQHDQPFHDLREHGAFYLAKQKNNKTHEKQWQHIAG